MFEGPQPCLQRGNVLLQDLRPAPLISICEFAVSFSVESHALTTNGTNTIAFLDHRTGQSGSGD